MPYEWHVHARPLTFRRCLHHVKNLYASFSCPFLVHSKWCACVLQHNKRREESHRLQAKHDHRQGYATLKVHSSCCLQNTLNYMCSFMAAVYFQSVSRISLLPQILTLFAPW